MVGILAYSLVNREVASESKSAPLSLKDVKVLQTNEASDAFVQRGEEVLPMLSNTLKSEVVNDRLKAVWLLGLFGPKSKPVVPNLIESLQDTNNSVRFYAIASLGNIDPGNEKVVSSLLPLLEDGNMSICNNAAKLLDRIEADHPQVGASLRQDYVGYALKFLKSSSPTVRLNGVEKLEKFGSSDSRVINALKSCVEDENESVRANAAVVLRGIYPNRVTTMG